jgi:hypothetical protein
MPSPLNSNKTLTSTYKFAHSSQEELLEHEYFYIFLVTKWEAINDLKLWWAAQKGSLFPVNEGQKEDFAKSTTTRLKDMYLSLSW